MSSLTVRALSRATLARQLLLERSNMTAVAAVEQLGGMQAQLARPPYLGLWSRLENFDREQLTQAATKGQLVRATMMRGTLHLVSAKEYLKQRPALQPVFDRAIESIVAKDSGNIDQDRLLADARAFLDRTPATFDALRKHLAVLHPDWNDRAMGFIVRMKLPLLQVPSADMPWGWHGTAAFAVAETHLGKKLAASASPAALALRFFGAFGPASVTDFQTWSGFTGGREIVEPLRPRLEVFRDEKGRELFDLPDAPRPAEDTPAPVRFLPEYDNLLLAHADRSRIIADQYRPRITPSKNLRVLPTFLVDGFVAGVWEVEVKKKTATLTLEPFGKLSKAAKAEIEREGERVAAFVEPGAKPDVRWL
ncbi:MAG TPA: winged helix DNA-binding domain-containing protein [Thermoanaerobaculia bacterium]|jgi:hypothetical protein